MMNKEETEVKWSGRWVDRVKEGYSDFSSCLQYSLSAVIREIKLVNLAGGKTTGIAYSFLFFKIYLCTWVYA